MSRPWFKNKNLKRLTITRFTSISKHSVEQTLHMDHEASVKLLVERIDAVPADGDMMISFGSDAEHVELTFEAEGEEEQIHFYSRKIKTPSTGFNINKQQHELDIYRDVDALLFPEINKLILKIQNLLIQFPAFSITYLGSTFRDEAPVTLSFTTERYSIRDKKGVEQIIEIVSGQLPPKPFDFKVGTNSFILQTYKNNFGEDLYPNYFQIVQV